MMLSTIFKARTIKRYDISDDFSASNEPVSCMSRTCFRRLAAPGITMHTEAHFEWVEGDERLDACSFNVKDV